MRRLIGFLVVVAVGVVLAAGLLPPVFAQGGLDSDALNAARAGAAVLVSEAGSVDADSDAQAAVRQSIAGDAGVVLVKVQILPGSQGSNAEVSVSVEKQVHTFMSGWPGIRSWLSGWFNPRATQTSPVGT